MKMEKADAIFYKEKYQEMQQVLEGSRHQMKEFDSVN